MESVAPDAGPGSGLSSALELHPMKLAPPERPLSITGTCQLEVARLGANDLASALCVVMVE